MRRPLFHFKFLYIPHLSFISMIVSIGNEKCLQRFGKEKCLRAAQQVTDKSLVRQQSMVSRCFIFNLVVMGTSPTNTNLTLACLIQM